MNLKLVLGISIIIVIASASIVQTTNADNEENEFFTDLIAGQYIDSGDITVWTDNNYLYVKYKTTEDWKLSETQLQVVSSFDNIPLGWCSGNPITSKFNYRGVYDPELSEYTYKIYKNWGIGTQLFIAAHAVVCKSTYGGNLDDIEACLPERITMEGIHAMSCDPEYYDGYFKINIVSDKDIDGSCLGGSYNGWCIDLDTLMKDYYMFEANVYSSYESFPAGNIEYPENMDFVNYIINQHYVGKTSKCAGDFTYGDIQRAIWSFIENQQSTLYIGPWEECRVQEIIADAMINGEDFAPECGDVFAVMLVPANSLSDGQIVIIEVPIPCELETHCEPAWGDGIDFTNCNPAMYFTYTIQ